MAETQRLLHVLECIGLMYVLDDSVSLLLQQYVIVNRVEHRVAWDPHFATSRSLSPTPPLRIIGRRLVPETEFGCVSALLFPALVQAMRSFQSFRLFRSAFTIQFESGANLLVRMDDDAAYVDVVAKQSRTCSDLFAVDAALFEVLRIFHHWNALGRALSTDLPPYGRYTPRVLCPTCLRFDYSWSKSFSTMCRSYSENENKAHDCQSGRPPQPLHDMTMQFSFDMMSATTLSSVWRSIVRVDPLQHLTAVDSVDRKIQIEVATKIDQLDLLKTQQQQLCRRAEQKKGQWQLLGAGQFASVYRAKWTGQSLKCSATNSAAAEWVAVKALTGPGRKDWYAFVDDFREELKIHRYKRC